MRIQVSRKARDALLVIVCVGILSSCASMSKDECKTADWETVGYSDGSKGGALSNIGRHQKACAGIVTPDLDAYTRGHVRGVEEYCVAGTGYKAGVRGRPQNSVCVGGQWSEYQAAYQYGMDINSAKKSIQQLTKDLQAASQAKVDAEHEVKLIEAELVSPGLPTHKRVRLLERSKELEAMLPDYDGPILDSEHELRIAVDSINALYANNPYANTKPMVMPRISVVVPPDPKPERRSRQHGGRDGKHADSRKTKTKRSGYTHRPLWKKSTKIFHEIVETEMQDQCSIKGKGRFNQKRITRAIDRELRHSYLGEFNCSVSHIDGSVCNNVGNHWYTSIGCEAKINGEERLFGLTNRCKRKNGKLKCKPVKEPNMGNIHRKEVLDEIGEYKFNKLVKKCFSIKRGSGRVQHGNDNFSRCFGGLVLHPDENVCNLLGRTEDNNPSLSDFCYLTLASRSRDAYFCDQTIWADFYDECREKANKRR